MQPERGIMIDIGSDCVAARVPTVQYVLGMSTDCPLSRLTLNSSVRVWVCIKAEINWLCVGLPNALFTFVYACHRFDCRLSIPALSLSPVSFLAVFLFVTYHTIVREHFCTHFFVCGTIFWPAACRTF